MAWFDIAILTVLLLSTLISLIRGFVKESISLATWLIAGFIAVYYHQRLSEMIMPYFADMSISFINPSLLSMAVAFAILFITTLIIGAIVNFMVGQLVSKTGLSGTDKLLGMIFGAARGVLIISIIVFAMLAYTTFPTQPWWQDSLLVDYFKEISVMLKDFMPQDLASRFTF